MNPIIKQIETQLPNLLVTYGNDFGQILNVIDTDDRIDHFKHLFQIDSFSYLKKQGNISDENLLNYLINQLIE